MIGGAILDAFNPNPKLVRQAMPVARAAPQFNVVQRNAKPSPAAIKQHLGRLQAYSRVMQDWVVAVCKLSDEQATELAAICEHYVERSQRDWLLKPRSANHRSGIFGDTSPIKFTLHGGAVDEIELQMPNTSLQSLLTVEQTDAFNAAISERKQFQKDCMIEQIINIMDAELFLTVEQQRHFRTTLPSLVPGVHRISLSLTPQDSYYPQTSIASLMRRGARLNVLTDIQETRAQDFSATDRENVQDINQQHLRLRPGESAEQWHDQLEQCAAIQRDRVYQACAVRASYHQAVDDLSESQTRHLMVAAKGVAEDIVRAWKKQTQNMLTSITQRIAARGGQFGGNISFPARAVDLALIDQNSIWQRAVAKFANGTRHAARIRGESRRQADAATIVGFLDRELWLQQDQRSQLTKLVYECVPENGVAFNQSTIHFADVSLILLPLFRMSQQDVSMLTPPQQDVWKKLRAHFHFTERAAHVLNLANGGSMSIEIAR
jgi:hypothetical protein